jgi:adenine-specific DNA methylase
VARSRGETKPERIAKAVAAAVQAGKEWHLPGVDFNDPNRPPTCLEVDFPILPINHVAAIEGNAGKPIYQMSKWWARRRSSVFRAMLIAAATKAPEDKGEAAKLVWDAYYGNHQKNESFRKLKVADIFMGGGTTVVEGARLGMQMFGNDLNPVAWFVVKNELAQVDPADVQKLLDQIEAEVKPQIMPFYACDCPRGHKGKWTHTKTKRVMGPDFDPLALTPEQRPDYAYEGPEVIYTFWSKHGPCSNAECGHRTPIMSSPVVAVKTLSVGVWRNKTCSGCEQTFDVEAQDARMAPAALFVKSPDEPPYTVVGKDASYACPHCGLKQKGYLGDPDRKDKKVDLTLLIHPDWLKGAPGKDAHGNPFGGSVTDDSESTSRWNAERARTLKLIEVRGKLPDEIECPDTHEVFRTDEKGGTIPKQAQFGCRACGLGQEIVVSVQKTKKSGPVAAFVIEGYCPTCKKTGYPDRFFSTASQQQLSSACRDWERTGSTVLDEFWPKETIPLGYMSPVQNDLPAHGMPKWADLYNYRQLLVNALLLKAIRTATTFNQEIKEFVLGGYQQYLKNQCMLSFWHRARNHYAPALSERNYHPKNTSVEVGVFTPVGYGPWTSVIRGVTEATDWLENPWELVPEAELQEALSTSGISIQTKSVKVAPGDKILGGHRLDCRSASDLPGLQDGEFDLVITDPPFGGLIHYSELADFFYAWLRLALRDTYPEYFSAANTPKMLEAVSNKARNPNDADAFYKKLLTQCWREAARILKPSGILAFTFHHSEDEPWVAVLESLFDAGFYLEATYPIRSDETKGDGEFGSKTIEYDIIHVCRKRMEEPKDVSWARLRRQIMGDVRQLQDILSKHQSAGLQLADMQVIRRGKALEYYSKHYGKVFVEKGREFTVREALLAINQLLEEQQDTSTEAPPPLAEPYTRQFFRLFADKTSVPRDQMQKYLRGTGVSPQEFVNRGWCTDNSKTKAFTSISPLDWAQSRKGVRRSGIIQDFDQVMFMVGSCHDGSGIKLSDTLDHPEFKPHPATESLLDWLIRHGATPAIKNAARTALQLYRSWVAKNQKKVQVERTLFDLVDEEA